MSAVTVPAEETEEFDLDVKFEDGIGVTITVKYPKGEALAAIQALGNVTQPPKIQGLLYSLRDDPSVAARLSELGLGLAYDDLEDDW